MLSKTFVAATLLALAAATVANEPANQCNSGSLQCCDTVESASSPSVAALLGLLGVVLQDTNVMAGLTCTPINVIGVGSGGSCTQQPVCCENNSFSGTIAIGCTPFNLSL